MTEFFSILFLQTKGDYDEHIYHFISCFRGIWVIRFKLNKQYKNQLREGEPIVEYGI